MSGCVNENTLSGEGSEISQSVVSAEISGQDADELPTVSQVTEQSAAASEEPPQNANAPPPSSSSPSSKPPAQPEIPNPLVIDLTDGENASCFAGLGSDALSVNVSSQSGGGAYTFKGVYLSKVLEKLGVTSYEKIEAVASDLGPQDITSQVKNGDVILAWEVSKNGADFASENPIRICPKNATTANQLVKNIVQIVVTV